MTLNDYYKQYGHTSGIIPQIFATQYEFLADYFANQTEHDSKALLEYGTLVMASDDETTIYNAILAAVKQNAEYKWPKLYETMLFEYNPIWNVDGETITQYGEQTQIDNIGARTKTSTGGERDSSTTSHVVPYDSTTETETGKEVTHAASVTDTEADAAASDTHIASTHTDSVTRRGNQGITSTQKLITEERAVVDFNFFSLVLKDVIEAVTIPYFETSGNICPWRCIW